MRRLVAVVALAGCSFATVRGPGEQPYRQRPECTRESLAPYADAALAGVGIVTMLFTLLAWAASSPEKNERGNYELGYYGIGIVGGPLGGTAFAISAGWGKWKIGKCRRAQDRYDRYTQQPQPQPAPYDPAPPDVPPYQPPYAPPHPDPAPQP
jgi:hypothetical protein